MNDLLKNLVAQVEDVLPLIFTTPTLAQLGVLVLLISLGVILGRFVKRLLLTLVLRLKALVLIMEYMHWLPQLMETLTIGTRFLLVWVLGRIAISTFDSLGQPGGLLRWVVPLFGLLFLYHWLPALLALQFNPERVAGLRQRVLRPLLVVVVLLHAMGLLDDTLDAGFNFGSTQVRFAAIFSGLILFYFTLELARYARLILGEKVLPRAGVQESLTHGLATFIGYIIIIGGFVMAISITGIPLTALTVILGGLSVGIGFGMQELISNFISGFILMFEGAVSPGDVVEVGDTIGVVNNVGIRAMRIKNYDNIELIVPNNLFLTQTVTNYTRGRSSTQLRVHIVVGVSYDADPFEVREVLLAAAEHPDIMETPAPSIFFSDFGDSSLNFDLMVWTRDAVGVPKLQSDLRYRIWAELKAHKIEIPFPQRDIHVRSVVPIPLNGAEPQQE